MLGPNISNKPRTLFSPAKAVEVAAAMQGGDYEDFIFVVVHCPKGTGLSFVEVRDAEDNYLISHV